MQIILALVVLVIAIALIRVIARLLFAVLKISVGLVLVVPFGPPFLVGFLVERATAAIRLRLAVAIVLSVATAVAFVSWGFLGSYPALPPHQFESMKFGLPAALFLALLYMINELRQVERRSFPMALFSDMRKKFYMCFFAAFCFQAIAALMPYTVDAFDLPESLVRYASWVYWFIGVVTQSVVLAQCLARKELSKTVEKTLTTVEKVNASQFASRLAADSILDDSEVHALFDGIAAKQIDAGVVEELELNGARWFFRRVWYRDRLSELQQTLAHTLRHSDEGMVVLTRRLLALPPAENDDFINRHIECGQHYPFEDGRHFVSYERTSHIRSCVACGLTESLLNEEDGHEAWYCSKTCEKTDEICLKIRDKPQLEFIGEATSNGFVLMAGAAAWSENHKIFATGGQGHGFAAERANHLVDRYSGKRTTILGDSNAKNGADRLVQGDLVQTKYCKSAQSSVDSAFDPKINNTYRYLDTQGHPMQLEVPKDQYDKAVKLMQSRIRKGQVPGYDPAHPERAAELVRKGHLTLEQARNVTQFGTFESLTYDVAEGAVVSVAAGGISFALTAAVYYVNTKDAKTAVLVATLQGGKAFGKTLTIYVGTQQLHRLGAVQSVLKHVDVSRMSSTTVKVLKQGMGVDSVNGLNKALRGTAVTAVVVIAITTGPDMVKLMRGRISQAQFLKNLAVVSSGVVGGTVGAIAGGFLLSPLGPIGAVAGRISGGIIGSIITSSIANMIAGSLMEDDRVEIMRIVQVQLEYLAVSFMLTEAELDNVNVNLEKVITPKALEVIYSAKKNRRAMANFFLKPTVIGVIKQRPTLTYHAIDVIEACEELAA